MKWACHLCASQQDRCSDRYCDGFIDPPVDVREELCPVAKLFGNGINALLLVLRLCTGDTVEVEVVERWGFRVPLVQRKDIPDR